jgi:hypothetical protein
MAFIFPDAQRTTLMGLNGYRNFGGLGEARPCPEDPTQAHCRPQTSTPADIAYAQAQQNALGPPPPAGSSPDRIAAYQQRADAFAAANRKVCKRTGIGLNTSETCKTQAEWDRLAGRKTNLGTRAWDAGRGGGGGGGSPLTRKQGGGDDNAAAAAAAAAANGGQVYPDIPAGGDAGAAGGTSGGMSTGMMVAIGLGALAVIGGGAYLVLAK